MQHVIEVGREARMVPYPDVLDVAPLNAQLDAHPELWNQHPFRTQPGSPHAQVDDIWVRYNALENLGKPGFHGEHVSVWYRAYEHLSALKPLISAVMDVTSLWNLGGVLITRIPAGKRVLPHQDHGWHAKVHQKFAVLLKGDESQAFHFEGETLIAKPGDIWAFNNAHTHHVTNDSDQERITLIICLR